MLTNRETIFKLKILIIVETVFKDNGALPSHPRFSGYAATVYVLYIRIRRQMSTIKKASSTITAKLLSETRSNRLYGEKVTY